MKKLYDFRNDKIGKKILVIIILVFSFVIVPPGYTAGKDAKLSRKIDRKKDVIAKNICKEISLLYEHEKIDKYAVDSISLPDRPQDDKYINLDIDNDGKVEVSTGSEGSFLDVELSTGVNYDLDENGPIKIVKLHNHLYAFVTNLQWDRQADGIRMEKVTGHHLYLLTRKNAKLICDNF